MLKELLINDVKARVSKVEQGGDGFVAVYVDNNSARHFLPSDWFNNDADTRKVFTSGTTYEKVELIKLTELKEVSLSSLLSGREYHPTRGHGYLDFDVTKNSLPNVDDLIALLGKGARAKNKENLKLVLSKYAYQIENCGILARLTYDVIKNQWDYCAGQDYPAEITFIRNHIIN